MNNREGAYPKQIKFKNNILKIAFPGRVYKSDTSFGNGHSGPVTIMLTKLAFNRTESFDGKMTYYTSVPNAMIPIKSDNNTTTKYETIENLNVRFLEEADTDPSLVNFENLKRVPRLLDVEYERIVDSNKPIGLDYYRQIKNEIKDTEVVEIGYYQHDEYVTTYHIDCNLNRLMEITKKDIILNKIKGMSNKELLSLIRAIYEVDEEILDRGCVMIPSCSSILDCEKQIDSILVEYKYYPDENDLGYNGIGKVYESAWIEFKLLAELTYNNLEALIDQNEIELGEFNYEK